jgi:stringent starvation protein B
MMIVSQKPYLIRAIHEWCLDSDLTPFLATVVDSKTDVPLQYVQNNQIVLNLSPEAVSQLLIDNEWVTFKATFGGIPQDVAIPITNVIAIFAQENGQGMQFTVEQPGDDNKEDKPYGNLRLVK